MRRTRKSNMKKIERKKNPIQKKFVIGSLCCLTLYVSAQMVTPTEAKFTFTKQIDGVFTTAFVFPKTISAMIDQAKALQIEIDSYIVTEAFSTSEQGDKVLAALEAQRNSFISAREGLNNLLKEVQAHSAEAANGVQVVSLQLSLYDEEDAIEKQAEVDAVKENYDRALHVQTYVEEGYAEIKEVNRSAKTISDFDSLVASLQANIQQMREAEEKEKARLEKLKKEEEEKRKAEEEKKKQAEKEKADKEKQNHTDNQKPTEQPATPSANNSTKVEAPQTDTPQEVPVEGTNK